MALLNKITVKASSLIEIIIASVIIMVCFTIAMTVLAKITGENNSIKKIEVNNAINRIFSEAETFDKSVHVNGILIESSNETTANGIVLNKVTSKKDDGNKKTVLQRKRLITTVK